MTDIRAGHDLTDFEAGGQPEMVATEVIDYKNWAEVAAKEAAEAAAWAKELEANSRFADLIARSLSDDKSVKFGYIFQEDGNPRAVMGSHSLTEMGEPGMLSFSYGETPFSLGSLGVGWHHDHARKGNIISIGLDEVDSIEVHPEGHVMFTTEHNDDTMLYVLSDRSLPDVSAAEIARSMSPDLDETA